MSLTHCAVPGCDNGSNQGYLMKVIPKDEIRRRLWMDSLNLPEWVADNMAVVCEIHFETSMWQQQIPDSGRRRLRQNALPTLYPGSYDETMEKPIHSPFSYDKHANETSVKYESDSDSDEEIEENDFPPTVYYVPIGNTADFARSMRKRSFHYGSDSDSSDDELELETQREIVYIPENSNTVVKIVTEEEITETSIADVLLNTSNGIEQKVSDESMEESPTPTDKSPTRNKQIHPLLFNKIINRNKQMNKKMRLMTIKLRDLQKEVDELTAQVQAKGSQEDEVLRRVFNDDQLAYLKSKDQTVFNEWSTETMDKALRLRRHCGIVGYEELLKQHIPLPSLQVLGNNESSELENLLASNFFDNDDDLDLDNIRA